MTEIKPVDTVPEATPSLRLMVSAAVDEAAITKEFTGKELVAWTKTLSPDKTPVASPQTTYVVEAARVLILRVTSVLKLQVPKTMLFTIVDSALVLPTLSRCTFTKPVEEAVARFVLPVTARVVLVALVLVALTMSKFLIVDVALLTRRVPIKVDAPVTSSVPAVVIFSPIVVAAYSTVTESSTVNTDKERLLNTTFKFGFIHLQINLNNNE